MHGTRDIGLVSVAILFFWMSLYFYVPFLPIRALELGASNTLVGVVISSYAIGQILLRIPVGIGSDLIGRRRPFAIAAFIASLFGALILLVASSPWILFIGRFMTGVAGAGWVAISVLYISYFGASRTNQSMSWVMLINSSGIVLATLIGGVVGEHFGGQATFILGVIAATIGTLLLMSGHEPESIEGDRFSLSDFRLVMRNRLLLTVSLIGILIHFVTFAVSFSFVPIYAVSVGASEFENGLIAASMFLFSSFGYLVTPWCIKLFGYRSALVGGLFVVVLSVVCIPSLGDPVSLMISQAAGGFGRGMAQLILMTLAVLVVAPSAKTTSMGAYQALYALGMFVGPFAAGFIADIWNIDMVFWVSSVISLLAVFTALWIPKRVAVPSE